MNLLDTDFSNRRSPESERDWREKMLNELVLHCRRMHREQTDHQQFWNWFCGEADSLVRDAPEGDRQALCDSLNAMLEGFGISDRYGS